MGSMAAEPGREPIAIIGLSCKFAGDARSPEDLWKMLVEGRNAWSEIPSSRFNLKGFFHPDPEKLDTVQVRGGHFLQEEIAHFDATFFNFSSELAAALDPQFRLQLESVYEALENAGLPMSHVAGSSTSVYASLWKNDYRDGIIRDGQNLPRSLETGTGGAFAAGRISHFFDLRGASMTIDTACSADAVALHQALQSLRSGEASMSIVGGSNLMLSPDTFVALGSTGLLSPDGKSYAFDSRANGFGRGEGVATLVVKRLKDALAAGDPVRAVIRETHLNHDGKKDSITSPSQAAQVALMRDCYCRAGIDPLETQYFEAHGIGTKVGDRIEACAIATVFQPGRPVDQPLRIGSIKTNIGHTEVTSGLAGIIKVVLSLEKGLIPPSVNFEKSNPELALESANLQVVTETAKWPLGPKGVRRASINIFGASGTNAHIIVEGADSFLPHIEAPQPSQRYKTKVLVLSAKSEEGCKDSVSSLKNYLKNKKGIVNEESLLENVMYTLGQRRTLFPWVAAHRVPFSRGIDEVINALESPQFKPIRTSRRPRIGMVFTGEGAQWHAMGRELIIAFPPFKAYLEEGERYLKDLGADWSLLEELQRDAETTRVNDIAISIPVCVALQISLARLLHAWGVTPTAVASHSSGEIAAAFQVGALSYKSAMAVAYYRAVLTGGTTRQGEGIRGGMIAIGAGIEDTNLYLDRLKTGRAVAACINSPSSVTVAGDISAIQEIEDMAKHDGIFARKLRIDTAYHSHHMDAIAEPYREALAKHYIQSADEGDVLDTIAFYSAVTGGRIYSVESLTDPDHWVECLKKPVRFVDAISDMVLGDFDPAGTSVDAIIEVGPHAALGGPIKEITELPEFNGIKIPYYSCLLRNTNARDTMQDLVASLLREGHSFDLGPINFPWGRWPHLRVMSDLPSYPWDHTTKHWHESRVNKAIRERSQMPNELLGSPAPWANPCTPSWRHIFRIKDAPWVRDHVIDSSISYPAAGFICRAIEGMAQIVKAQEGKGMQQPVKGYLLRDFNIQQALILPDNDQGVEIETSFSPSSDKAIGSQGWMQFVVSSVTTADAKWTQHATGMISVDYGTASETLRTTNSETKKRTSLHSWRTLECADFYSSMRYLGIKYGPALQNIKYVVQSVKSKQSESTFGVADTFVLNPLLQSHIVHPTTLDSVIQAAYTTLSEVQLRQGSLKVPQAISKLWVSNDISRGTGHYFTAQALRICDDARRVQADVTVIDGIQKPGETTNPVLKMEGLVLRSTSTGNSRSKGQQSKLWEKETCNKLEWAADMSLANTENMQSLKQQFCSPPDPKETQIIMDLRRVCIYFIDDALTELTESDIERVDDHHKKYHAWLKGQLQLAKTGKLGPNSAQWTSDDPAQRRRRIDEAAKASVNGELTCQVGPHLAGMLRREVAPLEVVMEGKLLYRYHNDMLKSDRSFQHAATLLQRIVHKNPRARILEVGGSTGSKTRYCLEALGTAQTGGPKASLYHFTDVSAAFFEAAAVEFSEWSKIMQYTTFDAEKDPSSQGFESGSYDIVIACQLLHATKSMANILANVRRLLKPGGSLLVVTTTKDQMDVQFVSGLVPGWWLSEEEERTSSPSLSVPFWNKILKVAGFTGVDLEVHDCESEELYSFSTIMSTAQVSQPQKLAPEGIVLVTSGKAPPPSDWQESLQHAIAATTSQNGPSIPVQLLESSDATAYTGKVCVFLGEMNQALLHNLEAPELESIKAMITSCKGLLWITHGGAVESEQPDRALAVGLLRSMRNEYVGRKFLTLDLDPKTSTWSEKSTSAIVQVLKTEFANAYGTSAYDAPNDFEYAERDGWILVPRLQKSIHENNNILPESTDYSAKEGFLLEPFHQADYPLSLQISVPSLLDTVAFDHDVRPDIRNDSAIAENMIQIEPYAYGVNNRDFLVALDQLDKHVIGVECAGIITKVGSLAASNGYAPGDRVFGFLRGPFASRVLTIWTNLMHIPDALTFEEAASIPVAFSTAFIGLCEIGRLQRGQSVLIHAAAGDVGQAAIMIAQHIGATIFATVSSTEKKALIISKYGIPEGHIFSSQDTSFVQGILSEKTEGVDVVLNSLSGSLLQSSFDIVAPFGHFVEIGARDLERNSSLEMSPFARQISFSSVNLLSMMLHRPQDVHRILNEVTRMLTEKILAPVWPIIFYPIADTAQAFEYLTTRKRAGKVVLRTGLQETVPVLLRRQNLRLSPNSSYLLVGGVGGIGRSVATWMIEHHAKNLILLSRSAGDARKTGGFVTEIMEETGCRIKAISCDVSTPSDLVSALQQCEREGLPPVRGIIQAAMVLQDSVLEQMTIDAWKTAILPKVNGTWNLHSQFPQASDLEFFVILSSNVGTLGNASQSNYAAGCTYQDALARWRVNRGLPCVSIDLPAVKSVGYIAKTAGVRNRLARLGHMVLDEDIMLKLIESAILAPFGGQIVAGINVGPGAHWNQYDPSQLGRDARFWALRYRQPQQQKEASGGKRSDDSLPRQLATVFSRSEAERLVTQAIAQKLGDVFTIPTDDVDMTKSPGVHGVDSLVAVELRNMFRHQVAAEISTFEIMQSPSLAALAGLAALKSEHVKSAGVS